MYTGGYSEPYKMRNLTHFMLMLYDRGLWRLRITTNAIASTHSESHSMVFL